jgi:hypothetical protein
MAIRTYAAFCILRNKMHESHEWGNSDNEDLMRELVESGIL